MYYNISSSSKAHKRVAIYTQADLFLDRAAYTNVALFYTLSPTAEAVRRAGQPPTSSGLWAYRIPPDISPRRKVISRIIAGTTHLLSPLNTSSRGAHRDK